jgi:hypothetical protein
VIEPHNSFADQIIRNKEVGLFIQGLIEKGVKPSEIVRATTLVRRAKRKPSLKDSFLNEGMYDAMVRSRHYGGHRPGGMP